jgi:hypothetical protein
MGIENERTALSIESIPKSLNSQANMEISTDVGNSGESVEPAQRTTPQKTSEKNGEQET